MVGHYVASIVDAAVAEAGNPELKLQLEICRLATLPNNERIPVQYGFGRDFSHSAAAFRSPVDGVALPSVERFTVEDFGKAVFVDT